MSSFIVGHVNRALGTEQDVDDEDVNTPLVSKYRSLGSLQSAGGGKTMTAFLAVFTVMCVCVIVTVATLGTAATADIAGGQGGLFFSTPEKDATVLHNVHRQKVDWGKTAKDSPSSSQSNQQVENLRRQVHELENELRAKKGGTRMVHGATHAHTHEHSRGASAARGRRNDYEEQVLRKEKEEEAGIRKKVDSIARAASKVDVAGLDSKHQQILKEMKHRIHQANVEARARANQDLLRRQAEIDAIMPSDDDCPGPRCLLSSHPHSPARAAEHANDDDSHRILILHKHPPWHTHYPSEFTNVYNSRDMPWLGDIKITHGAHQ